MIEETVLTKLLGEFHSNWGYAAGMTKLPGFIPGAKTFLPFEETVLEGVVTIDDTYFGKRGSGGMAVVSLDKAPILLIQYHGGETPKVPDEEVSQINDFLKVALQKAKGARLPRPQHELPVQYERRPYGYVGLSVGNIWTLHWVEMIYRLDGIHDIRPLVMGRTWETFTDVMARGLEGGGQDWIVFYHVLVHQRLH
ncbi:MAG: hypothetical protein A2Z24_01005 [Candidatus Woykebacteria bacterium RBG_16_44_10]|uniref:Uncharacterized protein n=1 Tax=Candidatus Woykebacteria bacterium RBG_16_44_10 TaxID=1802597 RepID=A0A1G1WDZ3_9BACT|nr:MAG: hypothetical protein A2Z24_01005 [Candidatus Woykebacteria bacterium RBG_16_44_10]